MRNRVWRSMRSAPRSIPARGSSSAASNRSKSSTCRRAPPQLVVELEHLADERRPQMEGRHGALGDRFVRPGLQHDLAIECAQPCSGRCGGIPQPLVQLCTGEDVGEDDRGPHVGEAGLLHRALQLESRRARRHDHRRGAHERELPVARRPRRWRAGRRAGNLPGGAARLVLWSRLPRWHEVALQLVTGPRQQHQRSCRRRGGVPGDRHIAGRDRP